MSNWNSDNTLFFILQYAQHPCLWNRNHCYYKSKEYRDSAIDAIVRAIRNNLPISRKEVRRKISVLRRKYSEECEEIKWRIGHQTPEVHHPFRKTIPDWFNAMDCFLQQSNLNDPVAANNMVKVIFVFYYLFVTYYYHRQ